MTTYDSIESEYLTNTLKLLWDYSQQDEDLRELLGIQMVVNSPQIRQQELDNLINRRQTRLQQIALDSSMEEQKRRFRLDKRDTNRRFGLGKREMNRRFGLDQKESNRRFGLDQKESNRRFGLDQKESNRRFGLDQKESNRRFGLDQKESNRRFGLDQELGRGRLGLDQRQQTLDLYSNPQALGAYQYFQQNPQTRPPVAPMDSARPQPQPEPPQPQYMSHQMSYNGGSPEPMIKPGSAQTTSATGIQPMQRDNPRMATRQTMGSYGRMRGPERGYRVGRAAARGYTPDDYATQLRRNTPSGIDRARRTSYQTTVQRGNR
jgi:hypothetical protein